MFEPQLQIHGFENNLAGDGPLQHGAGHQVGHLLGSSMISMWFMISWADILSAAPVVGSSPSPWELFLKTGTGKGRSPWARRILTSSNTLARRASITTLSLAGVARGRMCWMR